MFSEDLSKKIYDEIDEISKEFKIGDKKKEVIRRVKEEYEKAKINPGESIGIITAESFGEPGTQMILRTFHFAGVAEAEVSLGLPRLIEIFDARKEPSTPRTEIYLKHGIKNDKEKIKQIASQLVETKLQDIATEFFLNLTQFRIEINIDKKKMRELKITEAQIEKAADETLKKVKVSFSGDKLIVKPKKDEENSIKELFHLKEKSKEVHLKGIKGISLVSPIYNGTEFVILCVGANLKDVFKIEGIDITRTITNDIFMMADVLGIEAARQAIMNESLNVIKQQGLEIDLRHLMLLADAMTNSGKIKGITRSGITAEKESVLARASFETPLKHIVNASLIGEEDTLNSVIENVMVNQAVPLGTGLPDLIAKMRTKLTKKEK